MAPALELAHSALAEGRYEAAFATLEGAARRQRVRAVQARYWLHLAACYALYGLDGLENGVPALKAAVAAEPQMVSDPLYQALYWEFDAYRGASASEVKRGLRAIPGDMPPIAAYHAGAALLAVGASKSALRRLEPLRDDALPTYLVWRRWSLLGQAQEALGEWSSAAIAYGAAVDGAPASERGPELLAYASCLLELGRIDEVLAVLGDVNEEALDEVDVGLMRYVEGRAQLEAGNPNRAHELFVEARAFVYIHTAVNVGFDQSPSEKQHGIQLGFFCLIPNHKSRGPGAMSITGAVCKNDFKCNRCFAQKPDIHCFQKPDHVDFSRLWWLFIC
ncbi:MAG: hypothetical protein R6T93_13260, partial [Trueperaceae bacterium]